VKAKTAPRRPKPPARPKPAARRVAAPRKPAVTLKKAKPVGKAPAKSKAKVAKTATRPVKTAKKIPPKPAVKKPAEKKAVPVPAKRPAPKAVKPPVVTRPALKSKPVKPPVVQQKPEVRPQINGVLNGKPKKNSAGLSAKDLAYYTTILLQKRRDILGDMRSMEIEALGLNTGGNLSTLPVHMADMGTDNYEQEFTLGLVEKDRVLLREINHALAKIQAGTYGLCEGTGVAIGRARLEFQPWAKYSIEFARQREKNGMGVRPF
jgi:DnaK suppressor protein